MPKKLVESCLIISQTVQTDEICHANIVHAIEI